MKASSTLVFVDVMVGELQDISSATAFQHEDVAPRFTAGTIQRSLRADDRGRLRNCERTGVTSHLNCTPPGHVPSRTKSVEIDALTRTWTRTVSAAAASR